jgi:carboxypeptidase D
MYLHNYYFFKKKQSDANEIPWKIDGREPGYIIEERGLSYALIKGASHMVPYDKPTEMLSLFRQFIDMYDNNAQTSKLLKIRNSPCVLLY